MVVQCFCVAGIEADVLIYLELFNCLDILHSQLSPFELQLEEDNGKAREAKARVVQLRRAEVHKAALDTMAGETVSALFKSMIHNNKESNKNLNHSRENTQGGGGSRGGGRGSGEGSTEGKVAQGTHPAQGVSEHQQRPGNQRPDNQNGEEDYEPGRAGGQDSNNQLTEEKEQRGVGETKGRSAHDNSSEGIAAIPAVAAVPSQDQDKVL